MKYFGEGGLNDKLKIKETDNEKMTQIQKWKELIDEGELYLDTEK